MHPKKEKGTDVRKLSVTSAGQATPQWDDLLNPMQSTGETYEGWGVKIKGGWGCGEWEGNPGRGKKLMDLDRGGLGLAVTQAKGEF